jgi:hypothetical protein
MKISGAKLKGLRCDTHNASQLPKNRRRFFFLHELLCSMKGRGGVTMVDLSLERSEAKGYYVQVNSDLVGVFPSIEGHQLFINRESYSLSSSCWDMELLMGKESSLFTFYWNGERKISFKCHKHQEFFLWLMNLLNHRRLHNEKYA